MTNWKTTVIGAIALIAYLVKATAGLDISAEVQQAFGVVVLFLIALFARDANGETDE